MLSVGAYLRELRQRRGVSLEEIARTTRVAQRYLEAIETEAFETLPAPVFIRGFIRAYCQALGEPPEEALAVYDGREARTVPTAPHPVPPRATTDSEPRARGAVLVSFVLLVVLGMALFTVALLIHPRLFGRKTRLLLGVGFALLSGGTFVVQLLLPHLPEGDDARVLGQRRRMLGPSAPYVRRTEIPIGFQQLRSGLRANRVHAVPWRLQ